MSTDRPPAYRMGPTRPRDLVAVALVAAIGGHLLVRLDYGSIPPLPRLAGVGAAIVGVAQAVFGHGLRARIHAGRGHRGFPVRPPVPPLTAARAVMTAKATALAAAAVAGLWIGLLLYVLPDAGTVLAAHSDSATATVGVFCAVVMLGGALYLEYCCRAPEDPPPPGSAGR